MCGGHVRPTCRQPVSSVASVGHAKNRPFLALPRRATLGGSGFAGANYGRLDSHWAPRRLEIFTMPKAPLPRWPCCYLASPRRHFSLLPRPWQVERRSAAARLRREATPCRFLPPERAVTARGYVEPSLFGSSRKGRKLLRGVECGVSCTVLLSGAAGASRCLLLRWGLIDYPNWEGGLRRHFVLARGRLFNKVQQR